MRKELFFMVSCLLVAGCHVAPKNDAVKGLVTDATMNTVSIVTSGNDTLSFSTVNADKSALNGLLIGDSVEVCFAGAYKLGMEVTKIATVTKAAIDENLRLFREGIRVEPVDGETPAMYVLFTPDSLKAELYTAGKEGKEVLEQRTLPSGEHVWNVEDDDTKNLRYTDGCWTISQRGKLRFQQSQSDNNDSLGTWKEEHYEGVLPAADCPGIRYQVYVRHRGYSGDGHFLLRLTYLNKNFEEIPSGLNYTLKRVN